MLCAKSSTEPNHSEDSGWPAPSPHGRGRAAEGHNKRKIAADRFLGKAWQAIKLSSCPSVLEVDVPAFDETGFRYSPDELSKEGGVEFRGPDAEQPNYRHRRLLRVAGKRPSGCCTDNVDEIACRIAFLKA